MSLLGDGLAHQRRLWRPIWQLLGATVRWGTVDQWLRWGKAC